MHPSQHDADSTSGHDVSSQSPDVQSTHVSPHEKGPGKLKTVGGNELHTPRNNNLYFSDVCYPFFIPMDVQIAANPVPSWSDHHHPLFCKHLCEDDDDPSYTGTLIPFPEVDDHSALGNYHST